MTSVSLPQGDQPELTSNAVKPIAGEPNLRSVPEQLANSSEVAKVMSETGHSINKEMTDVAGQTIVQTILQKCTDLVHVCKADSGFSLSFGVAMAIITGMHLYKLLR